MIAVPAVVESVGRCEGVTVGGAAGCRFESFSHTVEGEVGIAEVPGLGAVVGGEFYEDAATLEGFEVDADNYWKVPEGDIYAKLAKAPGEGGLYRVEAVAREPTDAGLWVKTKSLRLTHAHDHESKRTGESYDEFYARQRKSRTKAVVSFPDQLFVNEKVAPDAEELLRKSTASAVAVFRVLDGEIVLTDIEIGGKPIISAVREN